MNPCHHEVRGTVYADTAQEAEAEAHRCAQAYFGDRPYTLTLDACQLLQSQCTYEVAWYAVAESINMQPLGD